MQDTNLLSVYQMRFPHKLWYLINQNIDSILWGETGKTILLNYRILEDYLQCNDSVFKTNNISSFVRQLNLYGFRKVTSHLQDPLCNSSNPYLHEYIHECFQYGRPELLDRIIRKTIFKKKDLLPENSFSGWTALEKARHSLKNALKSATQNLYCSNRKMYENQVDESEESDDCIETENSLSQRQDENTPNATSQDIFEDSRCTESSVLVNQYEECNNDGSFLDIYKQTEVNTQSSFQSQFLAMPDLNPDFHADGVELLGEFHINNDMDQGITKKINKKEVEIYDSLNCMLPAVDNELSQNYDLMEFHEPADSADNGDWEEMFNDIINKNENTEIGSDLKKLYSHISKTINLLNT